MLLFTQSPCRQAQPFLRWTHSLTIIVCFLVYDIFVSIVPVPGSVYFKLLDPSDKNFSIPHEMLHTPKALQQSPTQKPKPQMSHANTVLLAPYAAHFIQKTQLLAHHLNCYTYCSMYWMKKPFLKQKFFVVVKLAFSVCNCNTELHPVTHSRKYEHLIRN